eukprot:SAG31_NODE_4387_length_3279_cov_1.588994_4_plen_117_part_00
MARKCRAALAKAQNDSHRAADMLLDNMGQPDSWWGAPAAPAAPAAPTTQFAEATAPLRLAPPVEASTSLFRFDRWVDLYAWQLRSRGVGDSAPAGRLTASVESAAMEGRRYWPGEG